MISLRQRLPHNVFTWLCLCVVGLFVPASVEADVADKEMHRDVTTALDAASEAADEASAEDKANDRDGGVEVDELHRIVDDHMDRHLLDFDDPKAGGLATGAIVAAVDADEVLMAEGYGHADYERALVDPRKTAFNIGSATTSLSTIAVLQGADDGLYELDDPVSSHLDGFELNGEFDDPVRIGHLLDHTAGFYESTTAIRTPSPDDRVDLGDSLREHFPQRSRAPGKEYQHSHHGIALAGYLASQARGEPFVDLLQDRLFSPLGMDATFSIAGRVDDAHLATGHGLVAGELQPHRRRGVRLSPVDGVHTTAEDAAELLRFLVAGDADILTDEMHAAMVETTFYAHPEVGGVTPGFKEFSRSAQRWLMAIGESPDGFSSLFLYSPDQEFGFFVTYNSGLGSVVRFDLIEEVLDAFFPSSPDKASPDERLAEVRAPEFAGTYQLNRTVDAGFTKPLSQLMSVRAEVEVVEVDADADDDHGYATHNVRISHPLKPDPSIWIPITGADRDLWRHENGHSTLVVHRGDDKSITGFSHDHPDLMTFHGARWYQSPTLIGGLLAAFFMLFLVVTFLYPIQAIRRRFSDDDDAPASLERRRWLATLYSMLATVFFVGYAIAVGRHVFGVPDWATPLFVIPFVFLALAPLLVISAIRNYRDECDTPLGRLFYAIVAGAAVLLPFAMYWWDLLGFHW